MNEIPSTYAAEFRAYLNAVAVYDAAARELQGRLGSLEFRQGMAALEGAEEALREASMNLAAAVYELHTGGTVTGY